MQFAYRVLLEPCFLTWTILTWHDHVADNLGSQTWSGACGNRVGNNMETVPLNTVLPATCPLQSWCPRIRS